MGKFIRLTAGALALAFLSGCVAYPYETGFSSCDGAAGACYRACEAYAEEEGYGSCHASCEEEANRCFDLAYAPYGPGTTSYSGYGSGYGYGAPWYGSYGAWYPESGYVASFGVIQRYGYGSPRYGYTPRYNRSYRRGDRDWDGDKGDRSRGGDGRWRGGDGRDDGRGNGRGNGTGDNADTGRRRYQGAAPGSAGPAEQGGRPPRSRPGGDGQRQPQSSQGERPTPQTAPVAAPPAPSQGSPAAALRQQRAAPPQRPAPAPPRQRPTQSGDGPVTPEFKQNPDE